MSQNGEIRLQLLDDAGMPAARVSAETTGGRWLQEHNDIGRVVRYEVKNLTADNCPCRKTRLCDCYAKCNIVIW